MAKSLKIVSIDPTVFFIRDRDTHRQMARLIVENGGNAIEASAIINIGGLNESFSLGKVEPRETVHDIYLPDISESTEVNLSLWVGGVLQDELLVHAVVEPPALALR